MDGWKVLDAWDRCRDTYSMGTAGVVAPALRLLGQGGKICIFERRHMGILSVLNLQRMLPKLPFPGPGSSKGFPLGLTMVDLLIRHLV